MIKQSLTQQIHESAESNSVLSIIISGSGPTDRDGNNTSLKSDYLKMLAEGLFENGVSSYRYDKRGVGNSIGNIHGYFQYYYQLLFYHICMN